MRILRNSIKENFDYGVIIFLLTLNLIIASSYRIDNVMKLAHERFYTIAIGCALCLVMSLLVFSNWSGQALHDSTAVKFDGLAKSIEGIITVLKYHVTISFLICLDIDLQRV